MSSKLKLPPLDPDLTPTSPTTRTNLEQQEAEHAGGGVKPGVAEDLQGRLEASTAASESVETSGADRPRVESHSPSKTSPTVLPPIKGTVSSSSSSRKAFLPELTESGHSMAEETKVRFSQP